MPGAYQTSNFSYQGAGQFAYQEQAGVAPPKPFGRHPPRGLSRKQLEGLEEKWLDRKWLRHPTIEVPEATTELPAPVGPAVYEAYGLSLLGLASDSEVSYSVSVEAHTQIGIAAVHELGLEIAPPGTDHEVNLDTASSVGTTLHHDGSAEIAFTTRSNVERDLYLERPFGEDEIESILSRLPKKPKT